MKCTNKNIGSKKSSNKKLPVEKKHTSILPPNMADFLKFSLFLFNLIIGFQNIKSDNTMADEDFIDIRSYVFWPNATIPFYVDPDHFDREQSLSVMRALSLFAFKTCLKFAPVLTRPQASEHVMLFENPEGLRMCTLNTGRHSIDEPHRLTAGYECLQPPNIDMMIMTALGFPFEHNRAIRDVYIDVQLENVIPGNIDLFTKEIRLPMELRKLPYDINSVLHFSDRDFSKNGHRTIIFKDYTTEQKRTSLTDLDIKKIEIVYGNECKIRDRYEKIDLCQQYPGVARRKRDVEAEAPKSLRVNRDITPSPTSLDVTSALQHLGIENEVQDVVEQIYKISALALKNAREKYCSSTPHNKTDILVRSGNTPDILGVINSVTDYVRTTVDLAVRNLTQFCEDSKEQDFYQRARCPFFDQSRCRQTYFKSTKAGPVKYSTQHRPIILQSTKHRQESRNNKYVPMFRSSNITDDSETTEAKKDKVNVDEDANNGGNDPKADLRYGTTIKMDKRDGPPLLRSENDTALHRRRKRDVSEKTVGKIAVVNEGKSKASDTDDKEGFKGVLRAHTTVPVKRSRYDTVNDKRFFEGSRFRSKSVKGKKNDREYDDSEVSLDNDEEKQRTKTREPLDSVEVAKAKRRPTKKTKSKLKAENNANDPKIVELSIENKEFYRDRRWPNGVVYYTIKEDDRYDIEDMRRRLGEVNGILKEKTCVRLREIQGGEANKYEDYLVLDTSPDYVTGRVGGKQNFGVVELFEGNQHRQHAAMMVMAMLGFYFEVARHDRDKYIRVHSRHIRADKLHHFEKIRKDATLPLPYDYESATHPAWQFWRHLGKTGISTVATFKDTDPDGTVMKSLGQNEHLLSDLDIVKINSVYGIRCFASSRRTTGHPRLDKHYL